jgi:hypothetical protein
LDILIQPVQLFTNLKQLPFASFQGHGLEALLSISKSSLYFILLIIIVFGIRKLLLRSRIASTSSTWGCGYTAPTAKIQYTGSSFSRTYNQLFGLLFQIKKKEKMLQGIFPAKANLETHPYDKIEKWLIDYPIINLKYFLSRFLFIQNGRVQSYVAYGIVFIIAMIILTVFNFVS